MGCFTFTCKNELNVGELDTGDLKNIRYVMKRNTFRALIILLTYTYCNGFLTLMHFILQNFYQLLSFFEYLSLSCQE